MMFNPVPKPVHKRRIPKRGERGKFDAKTRQKIWERDQGLCQQCFRRGEAIHHVMPKSSGKGRGVFTNGLVLCNDCHTEIHKSYELLEYWINVFTDRYGPDFYKDEYDVG